ncbi:hypothetical protein [Frankia sp. R82]|uniref:hypothetical protein n=1 Tax=Frankia sp. R82 TaxID=2950553 RepID=UPI002044A538|nr:hypothetical protein [Frankia sp. R82]MCM3886657.1 hypothetical protein [Frankia sp. R82]
MSGDRPQDPAVAEICAGMARLLQQSGKSVQTVAAACGYRSDTQVYTILNGQVRTPPSENRATLWAYACARNKAEAEAWLQEYRELIAGYKRQKRWAKSQPPTQPALPPPPAVAVSPDASVDAEDAVLLPAPVEIEPTSLSSLSPAPVEKLPAASTAHSPRRGPGRRFFAIGTTLTLSVGAAAVWLLTQNVVWSHDGCGAAQISIDTPLAKSDISDVVSISGHSKIGCKNNIVIVLDHFKDRYYTNGRNPLHVGDRGSWSEPNLCIGNGDPSDVAAVHELVAMVVTQESYDQLVKEEQQKAAGELPFSVVVPPASVARASVTGTIRHLATNRHC